MVARRVAENRSRNSDLRYEILERGGNGRDGDARWRKGAGRFGNSDRAVSGANSVWCCEDSGCWVGSDWVARGDAGRVGG